MLAVKFIVAVSLCNLTLNGENKYLWISLLSSCIGYLLPGALIKIHVLHLISNSNFDFFPEKKISGFTVQLPKILDLIGKYEVVFSEIVFTNSWYDLKKGQLYSIYYHDGPLHHFGNIPAGGYKHPKFLVKELVRLLTKNF